MRPFCGNLEEECVSVVYAFHVFAVLGIDLDLLTFLDEERSLDVDAGLHSDSLHHVGSGVTFHALGGVGDGQDNVWWQFDLGGGSLNEENGAGGVLNQIVDGISDNFRSWCRC